MTMDEATILRQADAVDVRFIRFLYCGNDGLIRGKATHRVPLARRLREGIGLPMGLQSMSMFDRLVPGTGSGPVGEVRLVPDLDTFALLPYTPQQARLWCNLVQLDHTPWPLCPRTFLQAMLAQAARQGLYVQAAFETEFYLLKQVGEQYVPLDNSRLYSSSGMDHAAPVILACIEAMTAQGLQVEQYHPEHGPGQQEISIGHTDGLRAADQHLTLRDTIRAVAQQHDLLASFAPVPVLEQAGNGCHIHLSLWDVTGTTNLLYDAAAPWHLSALGQAFLGGILAHLPALLALTAPTVNSYRRLQPHRWSAAYTCYGPDNREAAIRLPSPFWQREMASTNLEFRPCDPSCNPYLALGALLAAGLDGLAQQRVAGPATLQNPALLSAEAQAAQGVCRFPQDLTTALDALEQDSVLGTALGVALHHAYLLVKRAEAAVFRNQDAAFELEQYRALY